MKIKKVLSLLSFVIIFFILSSNECLASQSEIFSDKVINEAKNGTVMVSCDGVGSAVAIGIKGEPVYYFLTNYHCVADNNWIQSDNIPSIIVGDVNDTNNWTKGKVVFASAEYDFAIIKTEKAVKSVVPLMLDDSLHLDDAVFGLGYPGEGWVGDIIYADPEHILYTEGNVVNLSYDTTLTNEAGAVHKVKDECMTTLRLAPGYSGGPLLNKDGSVVGLNNAGKDDERNSFAVKISNIIPILNSLDIKYQLFISEESTSSIGNEQISEEPTTSFVGNEQISNNPMLDDRKILIIIGTAGLIIVIAMVVILTKPFSGDKKEKTLEDSSDASDLIEQSSDAVQANGISIERIEGTENTKNYEPPYQMIIDNKSQETLFKGEINTDFTYRIIYNGENIANISVAKNALTISAKSETSPIFIILINNEEKRKYKLTKDGKLSTLKVPIKHAHFYFGSDPEQHIHMMIKSKGEK